MIKTAIRLSRIRILATCRASSQWKGRTPSTAACLLLPAILLLGGQSAFARQAARESPSQGETAAAKVDLQNAIERARANNQQLQSALLSTALAHEDRIQAKAGLFPSLNYGNQYIHTEGNGTPSGVFVANDGVHVYNSQGNIHQDVFSMARLVDYRRTVLAQAIAQAKAEVLARGLVATVVQAYYVLVISQRRISNAQQSLQEAERFVEISQQLEKGGEVAKSDVIKAQIVLQQRQRDVQDAGLSTEKAKIGLSVLIFPDLNLDFTVEDDLKGPALLAPFEEFRALASERSPELQAAQMSLKQESLGVASARSGYLPTFSFDFWYGINANQFAARRGDRQNLGYSGQASLNFPLWNWGVTKSKVRQAELRRRQAELDLSLTQKQLISELNSFYAEARSALAQIDSLRHSLDLAGESLRLTILRYQTGEVSVLEVVDSQGTLTQARNAYDDGLSRYRVALANLQTLTGIL